MIAYYRIKPRTAVAMDAVVQHGDVMGMDKQDHDQVLLWCATPDCPCWKTKRYRRWFRLDYDIKLGGEVAMVEVENALNGSVSVIHGS